MRLNFTSSQLARIPLAEFVSKLILFYLDFVCEPGQLISRWFNLVHFAYQWNKWKLNQSENLPGYGICHTKMET